MSEREGEATKDKYQRTSDLVVPMGQVLGLVPRTRRDAVIGPFHNLLLSSLFNKASARASSIYELIIMCRRSTYNSLNWI